MISIPLTKGPLSDHTARALYRRDEGCETHRGDTNVPAPARATTTHSSDYAAPLPVDEQPVINSEHSPPAPRRLRASDVALGAAAGALLTIVALVALAVVFRRHSAPELTDEALHAAQKRWNERGPANYRMDLVVTGRQVSRYHVEVQDGKPIQVLRDDRPTPPRTWYYSTVPGLFEILEHDMECSDDPTRGFGAKPGSRAVLRAIFDERLDYPRKFERLILGEPHLNMTWEIIHFESSDESKPDHPAAPS